jgi:type IV pilus assembly protein PilC
MYKLDNFGLLLFLKQFRVLLAGGYSVADSLEAMSKHVSDERLENHLLSVLKNLKSGKGLHDALFGKDHPFPESMSRCLRSMPQKDHKLEITIKGLEENYATRARLSQKPFNIMSGSWAALFCMLLLALILICVIPEFENMFAEFGGTLPPLTQFFVDLSYLFRKYWFLVLLVAGPAFYLTISRKLRFRFRNAELSYVFSLMLGQLESGANMTQALTWAADSVDNRRLEGQLNAVLTRMKNGSALSDSFREGTRFPLLVAHAIAFGEGRGDLRASMEELVSYYSREREWDLRFGLGPIIIMAFSLLLVGSMVISMYLPIFKMSVTVGG